MDPSTTSAPPSPVTRQRGTTKPTRSSPAETSITGSTSPHLADGDQLRYPATRGSTSILIDQRLGNHWLGRHIARTLRPTSRNRTLALRSTPPSQRKASRQMRPRPVPLRPQVDDVVDQRRQSPAHRLAENERLRQPQVSAHAVECDSERSRHAQLQPHVVRLPRREKLTKINSHRAVYPRQAGFQQDRTAPPTPGPSPVQHHRGTEEQNTNTSIKIASDRCSPVTVIGQLGRKELLERRRDHPLGLLRRDAENGGLGRRHHTNLIDPEVWFLIDEHSTVIGQHHDRRRSRSLLPIGTRPGQAT